MGGREAGCGRIPGLKVLGRQPLRSSIHPIQVAPPLPFLGGKQVQEGKLG